MFPTQNKNEEVRSLAAHHARIERCLDNLAHAARIDDPGELQRCYSTFERELVHHMAVEEEALFPALKAAFPKEEAALRAEHDRLRSLLEELGVGVELHLVRLDVIDRFIARLRAHALREDAFLYDWAARQLPVEVWQGVRDQLSP